MPVGRPPNPRLAQINGSELKRRKPINDVKLKPLGPVSKHLTAPQRAAWERFVRELPWLAESDRATLEVAVVLRAEVMESEGVMPVSRLNLYKQLCQQLGADSLSRNRVVAVPEAEDDDAAPSARPRRYFS